MNVIDSSCWLEYLAGSAVGDAVEGALEDLEHLVVPSITIYEVFKKLIIEADEDRALMVAAHMKQGHVVNLDSDLSVFAAKIGQDHKLAMADSIIYATAQKFNCQLWTQDKHFFGLPNVKYFEKAK